MLGDISGSQTSVIQLKISENYNDYGWFCDISGSPSADPTPSGYNNGSGNTLWNPGPGVFISLHHFSLVVLVLMY